MSRPSGAAPEVLGAPFRSSGEDTLAGVRLFKEIYRVYLQQCGVLKEESV